MREITILRRLRFTIHAFLCWVVVLTLPLPLNAQPPRQPRIVHERRFGSYDEAIRYVRSHYALESIDTSRSSWITSAEYFYADGAGYLILGMKGRPYLFAGVPREVWEGFKGAPSLGRYYHQQIKGRYRFYLSS